MFTNNLFNLDTVTYENVVMPDVGLPISFIEHYCDKIMPFCIMHWHEEVELVYLLRGKVSSICSGNTIVAEPGDFILVNSNEFHDYFILEAPILLYCTLIEPSLLLGPYINTISNVQSITRREIIVLKNHIKGAASIQDHFMKMWRENLNKAIGYEYGIKSNLYAIFTLLIRDHIGSTITYEDNFHKKRHVQRVGKVIRFIEDNYYRPLSLDDMAGLLSLNRHYFCRFFKDATGLTPMAYLNNYRIHQSMLSIHTNPDMSITEIALNCGFNDSNYFSRVFRSTTGLTPSEYKKSKFPL